MVRKRGENQLREEKTDKVYGKPLPFAETHLEIYRKARPESAARWAPLLYKVYLNLNRGTKFAEIERILRTI